MQIKWEMRIHLAIQKKQHWVGKLRSIYLYIYIRGINLEMLS